ncbi:hypothetical protein EAO70_11840 [Streptomyces sp. adm13(2018)]|uniref:hypothetical protein n=1 Tax=Streptomyces sp. adm13(2018) TaxID=2479007 RepID=UPI0011CD8B78|nr:hypothetical protein [Streptomyces sp. adm13(2018)]TXS19449.1 hypothetical protein EAO70_11840 [Streptomyces sp. adm13(2018)]
MEWDGFRLSLTAEGLLELQWIGAGVLEARPSHCASASLRAPSATRPGHELEFRFRFPGGATGTKSVWVRVDVPLALVDLVGRFMAVLWRDYSVPDLPEETGPSAEVRGAGAAAPGPAAAAPPSPAVTEAADPAPGAAEPAELERVPEGSVEWILSPAGERSEELFADVMERLASSDR